VKPVKPRRHPTSDLPLQTTVPVGKIKANLGRIGTRTILKSRLKAKKLVLRNRAEVVGRRRTRSRMGLGNEIPRNLNRNHNHNLRGWLRTGIPSRSRSTPLDNPDHHQLQGQDRGKSRSYNVPFLLFPIRNPLVHGPLPRQVLPNRPEVLNRLKTLVRNPLLLPVKAKRTRLPTKEVGGRTTRTPRRLDNNGLNGVRNPYSLLLSTLVLVKKNNKVRRDREDLTTTRTITARSRLLVLKVKDRAIRREQGRRARTGRMRVSRNGRGREVDRGRRREKRVGLRQRGRGSVEMEVEHPLERPELTISQPCPEQGVLCCSHCTSVRHSSHVINLCLHF
jgi:hypothetical protein